MKPGTVIELSDGRRATVVYHGLDGYGIQWGEVDVDVDAIMEGTPLFGTEPPQEPWPWDPEAMLREHYPSADVECVGRDFSVVEAQPEGEGP